MKWTELLVGKSMLGNLAQGSSTSTLAPQSSAPAIPEALFQAQLGKVPKNNFFSGEESLAENEAGFEQWLSEVKTLRSSYLEPVLRQTSVKVFKRLCY